jgi:dTDP-4-amino-4,6-dideoxygalactose transaminase
MGETGFTRRQFIAVASTASLTGAAHGKTSTRRLSNSTAGRLALLGGEPVLKKKNWPEWPYWDQRLIDSVLETTKSRIWCRIQAPETGAVARFEREFARMTGARFCVATGSGTQALHTCVEALGLGPGDEIITSPYTDPGTIAAILSARALPILADLDRESYQLDPKDVERRITERTRAIMPVHIMGQPCDMDAVMAIAREHRLRVVEDACQAHLAAHRGKVLGTIGDLGCFSFQSSKTIACGEGGAIIGNDEELMDRCFTVHNHGTSRRGRTEVAGPKYRMNELEATILLAQLPTVGERHTRRNENASYLTSSLKGCPGVAPQKLYPGTEGGSFYIYGMTYRKENFNGVDRSLFLKAVRAEGVDLDPYIEQGLHREPWVNHIAKMPVYLKMYGRDRMEQFREESKCPICDQVCLESAIIWASGPLLAEQEDIADVSNAILKVYENRDQLIESPFASLGGVST